MASNTFSIRVVGKPLRFRREIQKGMLLKLIGIKNVITNFLSNCSLTEMQIFDFTFK